MGCNVTCAIDAPFEAATDLILTDTTIVATPAILELEKGEGRHRMVKEEEEVEGCTSPHSSQTRTKEGWVEEIEGGCRGTVPAKQSVMVTLSFNAKMDMTNLECNLKTRDSQKYLTAHNKPKFILHCNSVKTKQAWD